MKRSETLGDKSHRELQFLRQLRQEKSKD